MTASTAPSRTTAPRNSLGLTALGLGAAGILVGVFANSAWFVVLPAGLLAVILGVFGVTQKRYYAPADTTTAIVGIITGAVTLALGIWGTGTFLDGLHQTSTAPAVASAQNWTTQGQITWGQPHDFGNNVVVAISAPVAFTPTTTSDGRAVVLSVTITNCGKKAYHPDHSVYAPTATFDGRPLTEIPLPGGTADAAPTAANIQPGRSVGYRVAYALPPRQGQLHLVLRPNPNAGQAVIGGVA